MISVGVATTILAMTAGFNHPRADNHRNHPRADNHRNHPRADAATAENHDS